MTCQCLGGGRRPSSARWADACLCLGAVFLHNATQLTPGRPPSARLRAAAAVHVLSFCSRPPAFPIGAHRVVQQSMSCLECLVVCNRVAWQAALFILGTRLALGDPCQARLPDHKCLILFRALQENNFQQPGERFRSFDPARQERFVTRIAGMLSAPRVTQVGQALSCSSRACLLRPVSGSFGCGAAWDTITWVNSCAKPWPWPANPMTDRAAVLLCVLDRAAPLTRHHLCCRRCAVSGWATCLSATPVWGSALLPRCRQLVPCKHLGHNGSGLCLALNMNMWDLCPF